MPFDDLLCLPKASHPLQLIPIHSPVSPHSSTSRKFALCTPKRSYSARAGPPRAPTVPTVSGDVALLVERVISIHLLARLVEGGGATLRPSSVWHSPRRGQRTGRAHRGLQRQSECISAVSRSGADGEHCDRRDDAGSEALRTLHPRISSLSFLFAPHLHI